MWSLVPLVRASPGLPWYPRVHSYDASLDGFGVVAAPLRAEKVAEVGRVRERMRFKDHRYKGKNPRLTSELSML